MLMKKIGIISNSLKDKGLVIARQISEKLKDLGAEGFITDLCSAGEDIIGDREALLVLGGDGSMLSVARRMDERRLPLLGVNLGNVGYLTEVELADIDSALEKFVAGEYTISKRMMLCGVCVSGGETAVEGRALNDIVLSRHGDLQVAGYRIYVNGSFLTDFYADGVIFSTPTGSTAYSMSAGGPIVSPSASLIVLTPVCPHSLNTRSIIFSKDDVLTAELLEARGGKRTRVGVSFDGGESRILGAGDTVKVSCSGKTTDIIKLYDDGFLQVLNRKFSN